MLKNTSDLFFVMNVLILNHRTGVRKELNGAAETESRMCTALIRPGFIFMFSLWNQNYNKNIFSYRVNVAFGNQIEFAQDFECAKGSAMIPLKRCTLWWLYFLWLEFYHTTVYWHQFSWGFNQVFI